MKEEHFSIPLERLKEYEEKGYSTDGVSFEENGKKLINVQKNFVFENAEMLTFSPDVSAVLARSIFFAENIKRAVLNITALGYFKPYFNGWRLTDSELMPPKSDYRARDLTECSYPIFDTLSHRIYYYEYDVSHLIKDGKNVLAAHIGAGWYADNKNPAEEMPLWGENMLIFSLVLTDKAGKETEICSSANNTRWKTSYIRSTSLYYGEYHDYNYYDKNWASPELDDRSWNRAKPETKPLSFFQKADFPADRAGRKIIPKEISRITGRIVYDLGEIAAGYPVIRANDKDRPNIRVFLRYADKLNPDGSFALRHTGGDWREQTDCFLLTEKCADLNVHPEFLWHASRYIELSGNAEITQFITVHTEAEQICTFYSSNDTLNRIFSAYINTFLANIHGCIPSDCPHRERLGYTGDGQLTSGAAMSVFDMRGIYKKWMRDIRDCQDIYNGHVQHTAPFYGGGGGPGGWGGAAVILPYRYYKFYNDISALSLSYNSMKAYIGYMLDHSENGIVTHGEKGGWCLGDWCTPGNKIEIPPEFVNTYFFIKCLNMCEETAVILGKEGDKEYFAAILQSEKEAFLREFFSEETGSFCSGVQGADAFALDLGLGDNRTKSNLINKYSGLQTFDTGIFGTDILIRVLFNLGEASLAFRLLTNEKETSFYNMLEGGTNTLWENWDGCDSLCHPMFGAIVEYFISEILGIKRYNDSPGYGEITISPALIPELKTVKGSFRTSEGKIEVIIFTDENGERKFTYKTDGNIVTHQH
ncbi:MAG: family 78 glycoside hydrolase catalytic domain [Oscillospiraceae bacterium]|nr:family 78 glycoside hydrolase catalytic domain [Oscillospiraceae bacterium]